MACYAQWLKDNQFHRTCSICQNGILNLGRWHQARRILASNKRQLERCFYGIANEVLPIRRDRKILPVCPAQLQLVQPRTEVDS